MWFFAILVVLALGGIALVAAGRGAPLAEVYDDRPDATVPADGSLAAADLRRVRFSLALRGYRMSEVDALLDRLASQLESHEPDGALPEEVPAADPGAGAGDASGDVHAEPERGEHSAG
ncbi:MAG: DivIVA domain-containing protein [Nocardioides sp.]|nr:DivIVA domain-containing protein [Nocardioidaceae bacterium]MCB8958196.1 DivIVA domain-containing protein [Nocardioides sp.]